MQNQMVWKPQLVHIEYPYYLHRANSLHSLQLPHNIRFQSLLQKHNFELAYTHFVYPSNRVQIKFSFPDLPKFGAIPEILHHNKSPNRLYHNPYRSLLFDHHLSFRRIFSHLGWCELSGVHQSSRPDEANNWHCITLHFLLKAYFLQ